MTLAYLDELQRAQAGDRRSLARLISALCDPRLEARPALHGLITTIYECENHGHVFAFTGPPGVGKSSIIETIGTTLCQAGEKLAVLSIDPSSPTSGGSILGDKTRMPNLAAHANAYVRPLPSIGALGGVNPFAPDVLRLLIACHYPIVFLESVGVGQSEFEVVELSDTVIGLMQPASGDELQIDKRGLLELVNWVVVNKCDSETESKAKMLFASFQEWKSQVSTRKTFLTTTMPELANSSTGAAGLQALCDDIVREKPHTRRDSWDLKKRNLAMSGPTRLAMLWLAQHLHENAQSLGLHKGKESTSPTLHAEILAQELISRISKSKS